MNVFTMPGVTDLVWMGASQVPPDMGVGLMHSDPSEMMLDHENPFFAAHHSTSNQSLDDVHAHHSPMEMEALGMLDYDDDIKHESNDAFIDNGDDGSTPRYMMSTATQTANLPSRKIKPIKHPGLVLKTPIAYQSDTDPSVIPIQKDGMAVCEKCGAIGVKHAFYTRERRFCSMACARGYSGLTPEPLSQSQPLPEIKPQYAEYKFKMQTEDDYTDTIADEPLPQLPAPPEISMSNDENSLFSSKRKPAELANSFDWLTLFNDVFVAAPVSCFRHAPMADLWENIPEGIKVEVENTDCDESWSDSFWVATVMKIIGYKALMRYEGFGTNCSKDFWIPVRSSNVHPVGWCATKGKPLIPPKSIEDKYHDWKQFLVKRLTGARTLPMNFASKVVDTMKSRFECGLNLEVVDKNRISQVKVAVINKIIGKRLHVKYYDSGPEDGGFWCHEDSPLIHPVGWARKVGHVINAPFEYLERVEDGMWDEDDANEGLFLLSQTGSSEMDIDTGFCTGMKLEAIDPLNLSSICVATVMDVLRCGYIMIRIDSYDIDETGADWFCYHASCSSIFPMGFCAGNNIPLVPPKGWNSQQFNWETYLQQNNSVPAWPNLFNGEIPNHGFVAGAKMEAADLMDPRLVCVATVGRVVGRLLKVHFDGWEEEYDQWLDCESPDIYPVGWCDLVGHKLEGPRMIPVPPIIATKSPKGIKKRGRKKKKEHEKEKEKVHKEKIKIEKPVRIVKEETNDSIDVDSLRLDESEPETGQESIGPDQSLPVASTEPSPPHERKATSYINSSNPTSAKVIPRLIDNTGNTEVGDLCPAEWNVFDVAQFLRVNDCATYCDAFSKHKIDGKILLELTKDELIKFTGGKVGPSLKIYSLIEQLQIKINPAQSRLMKANIKKFL